MPRERRGTVYVVGAGPGDPELLTRKAYRVLQSADVVLYDVLVGEGVIDDLTETAAAVDVGKRPDGDRTPQSAIHRRMIEEARRGNDVVRLKGGDPCVFGRGGEEAEALADAGIPFEFVPGVTSAIGVPESLGIPLTHREHASSLTVITGHEDSTKDDSAIDWEGVASNLLAGGTLVILMGVSRLSENVGALCAHGVPSRTPAATIEPGTLPEEFAVTGTLETIVDSAADTGLTSPAITVVGDVVSVGERVAQFVGREPSGVVSSRHVSAPASIEELQPL